MEMAEILDGRVRILTVKYGVISLIGRILIYLWFVKIWMLTCEISHADPCNKGLSTLVQILICINLRLDNAHYNAHRLYPHHTKNKSH